MRRLTTALATALALSLGAGIALAQTSGSPKPPATEAATSTPAKAVHSRSAIGDVVSMNTDAKTMTLKSTTGSTGELAFTVGASAAKSLGAVKVGDHVRVTYTEAAGQMTATAIKKTAHTAHTASVKGK